MIDISLHACDQREALLTPPVASPRSLLRKLKFVGSDVARCGEPRISGALIAALIHLQKVPDIIGAAGGITCINRRAAREQSLGLCRAPVVFQRAEHWVGVVEIICEMRAYHTRQRFWFTMGAPALQWNAC